MNATLRSHRRRLCNFVLSVAALASLNETEPKAKRNESESATKFGIALHDTGISDHESIVSVDRGIRHS